CGQGDPCCAGFTCNLTHLVCLDPSAGVPTHGADQKCLVCGGGNQPCCGRERAQTLVDLAKRCMARGTVCPQGESSDECKACGGVSQSCCVNSQGVAFCNDGMPCTGAGPGGTGYP